MNDNKNKKDDGFDYILIVIAFAVFWPVGIFLLLRKLGVFESTEKRASGIGDSAVRLRQDKYKAIMQGRDCAKIDYLASAVGVSYESTLRELQGMVVRGDFGPGAYINYVDKTLIIPQATYTAQPAQKPAETKQAETKAAPKKAEAKPDAKAKKAGRTADLFSKQKTILLIVGAVLLFVGAMVSIDALGDIAWAKSLSLYLSDLLTGLFFLAGGVASFFARAAIKRKANRYANYLAATAGKSFITLRELAGIAGVSTDKLRRDLDDMAEKELLPEGAYVDVGEGLLILDPAARPAQAEPEEAPADDEDRYQKILREIRQLNDDIEDPDVSRRIDTMEDLTRKIFREVKDKPEKQPQIKSFMSYYLPTTLKLLHSYDSFEESGADGDTVTDAKRSIESILDRLVEGFKKQLDRLYETEAMDISSDIDVLENMLRRDGYTDDGSQFGTVARGQ